MSLLMSDWQDSKPVSLRKSFGSGLVEAAKQDQRIVALSADLMDSVGFGEFKEQFGQPRCIEVGVAEQNLVTVASGLAAMGNRPFAASYAVFSPGRNWEQIRTTICLNNQPVKLVGSHAGLNVGPDGATHQCLEDIALMRSLPNMVVLSPGDSKEARQMAAAMADDDRPNYIRLPRSSVNDFLTEEVQFEIGRAYKLRDGNDVALIGTGTMTYQMLLVAEKLASKNINAEVVHVPTIKPLDEETILASAKKCQLVVTAEEGQIAAGFGSAAAEVLSEKSPVPLLRLGVEDKFGQSGSATELLKSYGLDTDPLTEKIEKFIQRK